LPGKVTAVRLSGKVIDIIYNNGSIEKGVSKDLIRLFDSSSSSLNDRQNSTSNYSSSSRSPRRDDVSEELIVGTKVEAAYRGQSKYYPGRISRVRLNGTFDIDYDDGEKEVGVDKSLIKTLGGGSRGSPSRSSRLSEGDKVEGNFRGRGRWYPGRIRRDRGDGTYDVDYDDGEAESRIDKDMIRKIVSDSMARSPRIRNSRSPPRRRNSPSPPVRSRSRSPRRARERDSCSPVRKDSDDDYDYRIGDLIEVKIDGAWKSGEVLRVRLNGTFNIELDNGNKESNVRKSNLRQKRTSSRSKNGSENRLKFYSSDRSNKENRPSYSKGEKVACYWYRANQYGASKYNSVPKAAIILRFNSDNTYTVELEKDGLLIDDVTPEHLKDWSEGTEDLRPGAHQNKDKKNNKWAAVIEMARDFVDKGKIQHNVPTLDSIIRLEDDKPIDLLERILTTRVVDDFTEAFKEEDRYGDKEINVESLLIAFQTLGGRASLAEVRAWTKKNDPNGRSQLTFNVSDFIFAYANIFFPVSGPELDKKNSNMLGKSLRMSGEWRDLSGFANSFGAKLMKSLEKSFDNFATKDELGSSKIFARDILQAFHRMGYAVTITRLQEWMIDSDIRPQDTLTLADFASIFSFFFSPSTNSKLNEIDTVNRTNMTLSEIAIQTMQEDRWRGNLEQTVSFIRRLNAGRSEALVNTITRIRDAFESQDSEKNGENSVDLIGDLFRVAKVSATMIELFLTKFSDRLQQQNRGFYSLPEIFEHFGLIIEESADAAVSIAEVFAMLRLHCNTNTVRLAADMSLKIIDNILKNPSEIKYAQVNIKSEEFYLKIWQIQAGQMLMKAIGFGDPETIITPEGKSKTIVLLKNLSKTSKTIPTDLFNSLRSRRFEIDQELVALEGAPSVSAAIREMRVHHTIAEVRSGVEIAVVFVRNVLNDPKDIRMYRVKRGNPVFHRCLGRLTGSELLMNSIGFTSGPESGSGLGRAEASSGGEVDKSLLAAYVLKSVSANGGVVFNPDDTNIDHKKFKFPSLDAETERFLWRRKADLDIAIRTLDGLELSGAEGLSNNSAKDAAHVLGTTASSLANRSATVRKSMNNATSSSPKKEKKSSKSSKKCEKSETSKDEVGEENKTKTFIAKSMANFMRGASAAQLVQISMIKEVFERMDSDGDGLLSMSDVRAYFRSVGRNATDLSVRKWIRLRDIDQDGSVSLAELVGSYALQLDPVSKFSSPGNAPTEPVTVTPIAVAFGTIRMASTTSEVIECCNAAETYIQRILDNPSQQTFWRISLKDDSFNNKIGRLFGGVKLMFALGYQSEENGAMLALRDPNGKNWEIVPQDVRVSLNNRLDELISHKQALMEPSISNIAAVSSAVGKMGSTIESIKAWGSCMETILLIMNNLIRNPHNPKYYQINSLNPNFSRRVSSISGGIEILMSIGFRESEGGTLVLDLDTNIKELTARKLEMEVGLDLIKQRIKSMQSLIPSPSKNKQGKEIISKSNDTTPRSTANTKSIKSKELSNTDNNDKIDVVEDPKIRLKREQDLQNEKEKRAKAETSLNQQKTIIVDLQNQITEFQENQRKNINLRQSLTINRLEEHDKTVVKQHLKSIGKEVNDFSSEKKELFKVDLKKGKEDKNGTANSYQTRLSRPTSIGDKKVEIMETAGIKNGMKVLIGSGSMIECRKVKELGSLILDEALSYAHKAGSLVRGFSSKGADVHRMNSIISLEFVQDFIEDIIPLAADIGEKNLVGQKLNDIYSKRAVLNHSYTVKSNAMIRLNGSNCNSVAIFPEFCKVVTAVDGVLSSVDFSLGAVELINIFEDIRINEGVNEGVNESTIDVLNLIDFIELNDNLRGVFEVSIANQNLSSLTDLANLHSNNFGLVNWACFCSMFNPSLGSRISYRMKNIIPTNNTNDKYIITLLSKMFDILDNDEDESLSTSETFDSFTELDGIIPNCDLFNQAIKHVFGRQLGEIKINFSMFLSVREEYSRITRTHVGGSRLYVRLLLLETNKLIQHDEIDASDTSINVDAVSPLELLQRIPQALLEVQILPLRSQLGTVLSNSSPSGDVNDFVNKIFNSSTLLNQNVRSHPVVSAHSIDIIQVIPNYTSNVLYALSKNGVVHVYDLNSERKLYEQRVIWAEPLPTRSVEGNERFNRWRRETGLDLDTNSKELIIKANETLAISMALSEFVLSLPSNTGSNEIISIDRETGLVAINNSIPSGSICFHDPVSLRRVYRVKVPSSLSNNLNDCILSISCGNSSNKNLSIHDFNGVLSKTIIWAKKSLVLCTIIGNKSLLVLSMLTGDPIVELSGHTSFLSCMSLHFPNDLIFTGSIDKTVRVWKVNECIPLRLANTSSVDNNSNISKLEKKITSMTLGTGSRQVLKTLSSIICSNLGILPAWRNGKITSFYDGNIYYDEDISSGPTIGVEVLFENATVQVYTNHIVLRNPIEAIKQPNGPPNYSSHGPSLKKGEKVVVYDVDPEIVSIIAARMLGEQGGKLLSYKKCHQYLDSLLSLSENVIESNKINIDVALQAAGIEINDKISLNSLLKRIFIYHDKYSSRCDRLLAGNIAPITGIQYEDVSKLLVTLDQRGCCCVWDPCSFRVSMTLQNNSPAGLAFTGAFPYSLISKMNIFDSNYADNKSGSFSTNSLTQLPIFNCKSTSFPIKNKDMTKGFNMDSKFSFDKVLTRGFIYVYKDYTVKYVDTSCFLPGFVTMENPHLFFNSHGEKSLINTAAEDTKFSQLYKSRNDILRIIYVVSCSHSNLELVIEDLTLYGIIQRGFTSTPSEQIDLVSFERPSGWLEYAKSKNAYEELILPLYKRNPKKILTGIVVSIQGKGKMFVALDYSNDVVFVIESQIIRFFDSVTSSNFSIGCRVEFNVDGDNTQSNDTSSVVLMVAVKKDSSSEKYSGLIPISIGRTSYPVIAKFSDSIISESIKSQLSNSFICYMNNAIGRISSQAFVSKSLYSTWKKDHLMLTTRTLASITSNADSEVDSNLHLALTTSCTPDNTSVLFTSLELFVSIALQRVSLSHPLLGFLDDQIGNNGSNLLQSYLSFHNTDESHVSTLTDVEKISSILSKIHKKWLNRTSLRIEEVYCTSNGLRLTDIESLNSMVKKSNSDSDSGNIDTLGPVSASTVAMILSNPRVDNIFAKDNQIEISLINIIRNKKELGILKNMILQDLLSSTITSYSAALKISTSDVLLTMCSHLSLICQPILVAVKDSPILLPPSQNKIESNFPDHVRMSPNGNYLVSSSTSQYMPMPSLKMDILTASRTRNEDRESSHFMLWKQHNSLQSSDNDNMIIRASILKLIEILSVLQRETKVVIPIANEIKFTPDFGGNSILLQWDITWRPLSSFISQHGGYFRRGKFELFRMLATNLIDSVNEVNERGFSIRSLSPETIILDETGVKLRLNLLPTVIHINDDDTSLSVQHNSNNDDYLMSSYNAFAQTNPLLLSCLPNFGSDLSDESGRSWDVWSVGASLFYLAFGVPFISNFELEQGNTTTTGPDYDTSASTILMRLLQSSILKKSPNKSGDSNDEMNMDNSNTSIADALQSIFGNDSSDILFKLFEDLTGLTIKRLVTFRSIFVKYSYAYSLTEWSAGMLWESIIQTLFTVLRRGINSVYSLRERLAVLPKIIDADVIKKFFSDYLGLSNLTSQEIYMLITSLCGDITKDSKTPYMEIVICATRNLSSMLEEIQNYGVFQQFLYFFSRCFSSDANYRPSLNDLRRLAIFDLSDETSILKAKQEARILFTPFQSPEDFVQRTIIDPLLTSIIGLNESIEGRDTSSTFESDRQLDSSNLVKVSTLISHLEELAHVMTSQIINKNKSDMLEGGQQVGPSLLSTGADNFWLCQNCIEIFNIIISSNVIPAIAMFTMKFLGSETSLISDENEIQMMGTDFADSNMGGLSMGSRLLMRVAKFIHFFINNLSSISRHSSLSTLLTPDNYDMFPKHRLISELFYSSVLSTVLMLTLGEESPVQAHGPYADMFHDAFASIVDISNSADVHDIFLDTRWSSQLYKLFQPMLIELVGEDGRGSSKCSISLEVLLQSDQVVGNGFVNNSNKNENCLVEIDEDQLLTPVHLGIQTRGSLYFISYMRLCKYLLSSESTYRYGKVLLREQISIASNASTLLPAMTSLVKTSAVIQDELLKNLSSSTDSYVPNSADWQRTQLILDTRLPSRLQSLLASDDNTLKISILKVCQRALSVCLNLSAEMKLQEPWYSLGIEFSSPGWVQGVTDALKGKVSNIELALLAVQCLRLMSTDKNWMKSWPLFDSHLALTSLSRLPGGQYANIRIECKLALKLSSIHCPDSTQALLDLALPNFVGRVGRGPIEPILEEAKDISFGSTIAEQAKFTDQLISWISVVLPNEICIDDNYIDNRVDFWEPLFEIAIYISSWVSKLCLALEITDSGSEAKKKEKTKVYCMVAAKQLSVIERILLHGIASKHPIAMSAVISCMWAPKETENAALLIDPRGYGLMACIDQLTANGTYVDTFLSLNLQNQIMQTITRLFSLGSKELIYALCNCGIMRSVSRYFDSTFESIRQVVRLGQQNIFLREYSKISNSIQSIWKGIISCCDDKVYEEVLDLGILQRLVENWLIDMKPVNINSIDSEYNPLVLRRESCLMLKTLIQNRPGSERLIVEVIKLLSLNETVIKEITILRSTETKKGSANSRKSSANILTTITSLSAEILEMQLLDVGVPVSLINITCTLSFLSPSVIDLWEKWGKQRKVLSLDLDESVDNMLGDTDKQILLDFDNEESINDFEIDDNKLVEPDLSILINGTEKDIVANRKSYQQESSSLKNYTNELFQETIEVQKVATAAIVVDNSVNMTTILDRMGHCVLAIKDLFDRKCGENNLVTIEDMTEILLDLGLTGKNLVLATTMVEDRELGFVDFPIFLEIYSCHCNLSHKSTSDSLPTKVHWIPTANDGQWIEADNIIVTNLLKEASLFQYNSNEDIKRNSQTNGKIDLTQDVWILVEDVPEVFALAMKLDKLSDRVINRSIMKLKNLLPGISSGSGKLCFQEILAVYSCINEEEFSK
jgi:Ca2+-binding EF-hand superfamily protein